MLQQGSRSSIHPADGNGPPPHRKTPKENAMSMRPMPSKTRAHPQQNTMVTASPTSPLLLCDHLIALAQEADRAGYPNTAAHLVALVHGMFDEPRLHR